MKVVITGQVGVEKKPLIEKVALLAKQRGRDVSVFHIGDMMYAEAPNIVPGRILDLPRERLDALRRCVFKDVLAQANKSENLLVNTHTSFRWKYGLFPAFDHDQMKNLDADLYITVVDNVDAVFERLTREHDIRHDLKDILVWREEEIFATEIIARIIRSHGSFYIIARSDEQDTAELMYRLIFENNMRKVYPSFPMTHVMDMPDVMEEIRRFRRSLSEHFIIFDPADLDEKKLLFEASAAMRNGLREVQINVHGRELRFRTDEVAAVADNIDGQIISRDFKLIDQSDMIVSYIPELPDGKPSLSSGVERELQHAFETTKEVYVIWRPKTEPSVFITKTANRVFRSIDEAVSFFHEKGFMNKIAKPVEQKQ
jgi:adenylate kinase